MNDDIRALLAREADEAEAVAEAEDRGEVVPHPGQRARQPKDVSQVYSLRLPAQAIAQLKALGQQLDEAPTALLRRFVMERLEQETSRSRRGKDPLAAAVEELLPLLSARLKEAGSQAIPLVPQRASGGFEPTGVNIGGSRRSRSAEPARVRAEEPA